jgi:heme/copper-type cytochrome/quinol oxidase subunit 1
MAITETRPTTEPAADETEPDRFIGLPEHSQTGLAAFLGTGDHRSLGRAYIGFALFFGATAWVLDTLYAAHQAHHLLPTEHVFQVYTASQIAAVLLFAIPLFVGLATFISPLQVGANTIAFPRAAAAAFWGWLIGSILVVASYAIDGGPLGGRVKAVDLTYAGLALVAASLVLACICLLTTIISLRTPGLWLDRIPMFSWSVVVAASIWVLTLPVLLANIVLIYVDHHYGKPAFFGAGTNQWTQVSWVFSQPQIYAVAIPALGLANDVVATLAGARQKHRSTLMAAVGAFGILTFGAFAQPTFYPDVYNEALFIALSLLIILPTVILVGGWLATAKEGRPLVKSPLLFVLGSTLVLLLAVIAGGVYTFKQLDLHDIRWGQQGFGSPYANGHLLLIVAVATLAGLGGVVYWAPKLFGRFAHDGLAKLAALVGFVGALVVGLPLFVYGFKFKATGLADSMHFLYGTSALGAALLVVTIVLVVIALFMGKGDAPDDAWGVGQSLEWATTSPPAPAAFAVLERVVSAEPLLDRAEAQEGS